MKKFFLSALALLGLGTMASALFYVVGEDGSVLYKMASGTPAPTTGTPVELGLTSGTLWADHNIGASSPESAGGYYAWGETEPQSSNTYDESTYKWCNGTYTSMTKYCTRSSDGTVDNKTELEDADDVAVQTWGGKWRMPTTAQQEELLTECYWVWTATYNGKSVNGYIVYKAKSADDKGKMTNESSSSCTPSSSYSVSTDAHIFLPAAGSRSNGGLDDAGSHGFYRSRSLDVFSSGSAYNLYFRADCVDASNYCSRGYGFSVRPVCPATK